MYINSVDGRLSSAYINSLYARNGINSNVKSSSSAQSGTCFCDVLQCCQANQTSQRTEMSKENRVAQTQLMMQQAAMMPYGMNRYSGYGNLYGTNGYLGYGNLYGNGYLGYNNLYSGYNGGYGLYGLSSAFSSLLGKLY